MLTNQFQFKEQSQRFEPIINYQKFYNFIAKESQLASLLISKQNLSKLKNSSKYYKQRILFTIAGSFIGVILFNKYVKLGVGFGNILSKSALSIGFLVCPLLLVHMSLKRSLQMTKQKVFQQQKKKLLQYQLTGDILRVNSFVQIVD